MGDGPGYNPYRKANGEFASREEVGDLEEKLSSDLAGAQSSGDVELEAQIKGYAMDRLPESSLGRRLLEDSYGASATHSKQADYSKLGLRELQKLAKDTEDPELQLEIARRGNSAARKNLARNLSATTEALSLAYESTDDGSVRQEIAVNPRSDLEPMEPVHAAVGISEAVRLTHDASNRELRETYKRRAVELTSAPWIDNRTVAALRERWDVEQGQRSRIYRSEDPAVDRIMGNPDNAVTEELAVDYANGSPKAASIVLESGKVGREGIRELQPSCARFSRVTDEATLREAAFLVSRGHWDREEADPWGKKDFTGRSSREIAHSILENPATPSDALAQLVSNGRADQLALYRHPNATEALRREIAASDPVVGSELRIERALDGRERRELKEEIIASGGQIDTRRGYHSADYQLDRQKIAAYELSPRDVERLMGDGVGYRYDPETGHYGGSYDSGD